MNLPWVQTGTPDLHAAEIDNVMKEYGNRPCGIHTAEISPVISPPQRSTLRPTQCRHPLNDRHPQGRIHTCDLDSPEIDRVQPPKMQKHRLLDRGEGGNHTSDTPSKGIGHSKTRKETQLPREHLCKTPIYPNKRFGENRKTNPTKVYLKKSRTLYQI